MVAKCGESSNNIFSMGIPNVKLLCTPQKIMHTVSSGLNQDIQIELQYKSIMDPNCIIVTEK